MERHTSTHGICGTDARVGYRASRRPGHNAGEGSIMTAVEFPTPSMTYFSPGKPTAEINPWLTKVLRLAEAASTSRALSGANVRWIRGSVQDWSRQRFSLAHELAHLEFWPEAARGVGQAPDPVTHVAREKLLRFVDGILAAVRLTLVRLLAALSRVIGAISFVLAMIAACRRYGHRQDRGDHCSPYAHSCRMLPGRVSTAC